jgi:hypothetical protein
LVNSEQLLYLFALAVSITVDELVKFLGQNFRTLLDKGTKKNSNSTLKRFSAD